MFELAGGKDLRGRGQPERWTALGARAASCLLLGGACGFLFWLPSCALVLAVAALAWGVVAQEASTDRWREMGRLNFRNPD
ncbi:MAG: hypothetical protein SNJ84_00960 [Verrucomicrobiia bacterium]